MQLNDSLTVQMARHLLKAALRKDVSSLYAELEDPKINGRRSPIVEAAIIIYLPPQSRMK